MAVPKSLLLELHKFNPVAGQIGYEKGIFRVPLRQSFALFVSTSARSQASLIQSRQPSLHLNRVKLEFRGKTEDWVAEWESLPKVGDARSRSSRDTVFPATWMNRPPVEP
jgi:hypothetical protein